LGYFYSSSIPLSNLVSGTIMPTPEHLAHQAIILTLAQEAEEDQEDGFPAVIATTQQQVLHHHIPKPSKIPHQVGVVGGQAFGPVLLWVD
jgi:hypothetical protein